jgi:NADH-quinone oxidoreductase subunit E
VAPTRGAPRLATWRQASRILAGFPDDQATGGHTAGGPTLAGLRIARQQGWSADSEQSAGRASTRGPEGERQ